MNRKKTKIKFLKYYVAIGAVFLFSAAVASFYIREKIQFYHKSSKATSGTSIYLDPSSISVEKEKNFNLDALLEPDTNEIAAVELHISFDPSKFNIIAVSVDSAVWNTLQATQMDNTAGKASVVVCVPAQTSLRGLTARTKIASFTFQAVGSAGSYSIAVDSNTQAGIFAGSSPTSAVSSMAGAQVAISQPADPSANPANSDDTDSNNDNHNEDSQKKKKKQKITIKIPAYSIKKRGDRISWTVNHSVSYSRYIFNGRSGTTRSKYFILPANVQRGAVYELYIKTYKGNDRKVGSKKVQIRIQ